VRKIFRGLEQSIPQPIKDARRNMSMGRVVHKGRFAGSSVPPVNSVVIEEGLPTSTLMPFSPVIGMLLMDTNRISYSRAVRKAEEVHIILVGVGAKDRANDCRRFPSLSGIFPGCRLGINVVSPLRSFAAMHLFLKLLF
jgi:hypothetical protein